MPIPSTKRPGARPASVAPLMASTAGPYHIQYEITADDPKMYTKPWKNTRVFVLMQPGQELLEYSCEENNKEITEGHITDSWTKKK